MSGATVPTLQDLVYLDGFDSPTGAIDEADWRAYAGAVCGLLGLSGGDSVYEVGCGAGAFLLALQDAAGIVPSGCDYSPRLVAAARQALPGGRFAVLDADQVPPRPRCDSVISNGVFFYFADLDYAARVLDRMVAKARSTVAVLELPRADMREGAEAFRRQRLTPEVYTQRYANLQHLYFRPEWFLDAAVRLGVACDIVPSLIPNYAQGGYRFGAVFRLA